MRRLDNGGRGAKGRRARYAAQIGNDFAAMARLFADDLVYVHSSGAVDGKESYIERQRSNALRYRAMRRSDVKVRVYGCVAIITGAGNFEVTVNGKESAVSLLFHSIWAKTTRVCNSSPGSLRQPRPSRNTRAFSNARQKRR